MRIILVIVLLLFSKTILCQEISRQEIEKLIRFEPIDDTVHGIFYNCDTVQDNLSVDKKIIVVVSKQDTIHGFSYQGQIFVLQRIDGKLKVIDSTKEFERFGGFDVCFLSDTLRIQQNYHKGGYDFYYKFNSFNKKYNLIKIEMSNVLNEDKKYNNVPTGVEVRSYDIAKQKLTIKKLDDWDGKLIKSRAIKRSLPKDIIPDLTDFINPESDAFNDGNEVSNLYDKIFNY